MLKIDQNGHVLCISDDTGNPRLSLREVVQTDFVQIAAAGSVDSDTEAFFSQAMRAAATTGKPVKLDLSGTQYLSEAGRRSLLDLWWQYRRRGINGLHIVGCSDALRRQCKECAFFLSLLEHTNPGRCDV